MNSNINNPNVWEIGVWNRCADPGGKTNHYSERKKTMISLQLGDLLLRLSFLFQRNCLLWLRNVRVLHTRVLVQTQIISMLWKLHLKRKFEVRYMWTLVRNYFASTTNEHMNAICPNGAFKSCRIHRIYELNAHERHHKVVVTSGKLKIFFKPWVSELGACQWKNLSDAMDAAKD